MIISEVSEQDCRSLSKVLTIIQAGEYSLNGKDICSAADTFRWVQELAQKFAESYGKAKTSEKEVKAAPAALAPSMPLVQGGIPLPGMGDIKIKSFNPGKMGKK